MSKGAKILILSLIVFGIVLCLLMLLPMFSKEEKITESNNEINTKTEEKLDNEIREEKIYEEYAQKDSNGNKVNISEEVKKEKTYGSLVFKNMQITNDGKQTVFLGNVTNISEEETGMTEIDILLLDKEGNELGKVGGLLVPLKPGETTQFNSSSQLDYANIYDFKIVDKVKTVE